jgi:hypothetical protein
MRKEVVVRGTWSFSTGWAVTTNRGESFNDSLATTYTATCETDYYAAE